SKQVLAIIAGEQRREGLSALRNLEDIVAIGRDDGIHQIMASPCVAQRHFQTVVEEGKQIRLHIERELQTIFRDDTNDAECGTAQREGVTRARRLFVDGPEAGKNIE